MLVEFLRKFSFVRSLTRIRNRGKQQQIYLDISKFGTYYIGAKMQRTLFWIWVANIAVAKSLEMEENIFSDHTYANLSRLQFSPFFEGPWLSIECIKLKEAFFVQCWQKDSFQSSNYMEERRFPETLSQKLTYNC